MVFQLPYEFVDKSVTPGGGMGLMKEFLNKTNIEEQINLLDLPKAGSNRGYGAYNIIESFFVSVWLGANRFAQSGVLRYDKVLPEIFAWRDVRSQSTYSRFFNKFTQASNHRFFTSLQQWFFRELQLKNLTVDFDSSVVTRYGDQQGATKGYNPAKPGRNSHHPLFAFVAETRMVLNAWLRRGKTHSSNNFESFLAHTLEIAAPKQIGLARCDSGFYSNSIFKLFDTHNIPFIIAAKMTQPMKLELFAIKNWVEVDKGIHIAEVKYKAHDWEKQRRVVVVRQNTNIGPKAVGKMLFTEEQLGEAWRYGAMVTSLDLPALQIWNMYRQRADAENRIKELKEDFGMDGFCMKEFYATESAFLWVMIAYNLISLFRQVVLQTKTQATLSTLRVQCFALGSWVAKHAGKTVLKMSVAIKRRSWLDGLFGKIEQLKNTYVFPNA
ncbi:MAG TPA: IS1380 family transposase [Segetibacter sp.]|nr:IS1380 family transposase [Segetibacter sp.]